MNTCARFASLVSLLLGFATWAGAADVIVNEITVRVDLIDSATQDLKPLPDGPLTLESAMIEISAGSTPAAVLERASIFPDVEAKGFLFLLNPQLDPGALREARQITIPRISGGAALTNAIERGSMFYLTVNPAGRQKLRDTIAAVEALLEEKRANLKLTAEAQALLKRIETQTRIFGPPLLQRSLFVPPDIAGIMTADLAVIAAGLTSVPATKNASLPKGQLEEMGKRAKELQAFEAYFLEERSAANPKETWPRAKVVVSIRPKIAGGTVPNLRVYYQAPGLYGKEPPRQFATLAPPSVTEKLNEAQYLIWAGAPGNATPLTDQIPVTVRQVNQPITIDLQAK